MTLLQSCQNILPILAIVVLLVFTYYIYVVELCVYIVRSVVKKCFLLILQHLILGLLVWSYCATYLTIFDEIPAEYKVTFREHEEYMLLRNEEERSAFLERKIREYNLKVYTRSETGNIRYCMKCRLIKPDRTHHCSTCEKCILKMDHHCPWVNNCIGFDNYKYFILTIFYTSVYCVFYFLSGFEYLIAFLMAENKPPYALLILGLIIALVIGVLMIVFFIYHLNLIAKNETTLESMRDIVFVGEDMSFDLGCRDNYIEVFGEDFWWWFIPLFTGLGNGYIYFE